MKRIILLLVLMAGVLVSCEKKDADETFDVAEKTVLMYLPWSTNLTTHFKRNVEDLESVIAQNVLRRERVLVFFSTSSTEAVLFEMKYKKKGGSVRDTVKTYKNPAFTTAEGITSILEDVQELAPANKYAMIIGCHGMGWIPVAGSRNARMATEKYHWEYEGVPLTRYFGGQTSDVQTDITTLAEGITNAGIKMEFILFDDCYMSSIEVAYDLKGVADYLIASPCEIMAYGMPYAEMGKYLFGTVNYEAITDTFLEFYTNYPNYPCGTIAVTVCAEVENMAAVMKRINGNSVWDGTKRDEIQVLDGYNRTIFYDFGDYVAKLCDKPELLSLFEEQLERTVPSRYRKHTKTFFTTVSGAKEIPINTYSGITISDPSLSSLASAKTGTAWYKATH